MSIAVIVLTLGIIMIAVGVLGMSFFGIKNIAGGKHEVKKIMVFIVPFVIMLICYLFVGAWADAALLTMMITIVLLTAIIALNGLRNTFNI